MPEVVEVDTEIGHTVADELQAAPPIPSSLDTTADNCPRCIPEHSIVPCNIRRRQPVISSLLQIVATFQISVYLVEAGQDQSFLLFMLTFSACFINMVIIMQMFQLIRALNYSLIYASILITLSHGLLLFRNRSTATYKRPNIGCTASFWISAGSNLCLNLQGIMHSVATTMTTTDRTSLPKGSISWCTICSNTGYNAADAHCSCFSYL